MTQQLRDTFVAHEHLAPDADLTLEAIEQRIRTRRRSRLAVTGAVVAVVGIVAGGAVVAGSTHRGQPGATPPAAKQPTAARTPLSAPDYVTIAAGWLPPGTVTSAGRSHFAGSQSQGYFVGPTTMINIALNLDTTTLPTQSKRGTPHDLRINGRPGREWSVDDWYYLAFRAPDGHIATVDVSGGKNQGKGGDGSAASLAAIGRHVARTMRFDQHVPINPAFRLSYVPAGLSIVAVDRQDVNGKDTYTMYGSAKPGQDEPSKPSLTITEQAGTWKSMQQAARDKAKLARGKDATVPTSGLQPHSTPGRPVQGHATHVIDTVGGQILFVDGVRPGISIEIAGASLPVAELYKIADGLILS